MLRLLRRLHTDEDRGLVLVLHDLSQAAQYADRVVLLDTGRVVANGPPGEVITEELIGEIYRDRVRVVPHPVNGLPLVMPVP